MRHITLIMKRLLLQNTDNKIMHYVLTLRISKLFCASPDAQRVLQRGALSLEGAELIITQMEVDEATHERECRPATSCTTIDMSLAHILEIRGFKPGTTQDTVEMFIENKSGESELQSCDYDTKTGIAIVEFKNDQGIILKQIYVSKLAILLF